MKTLWYWIIGIIILILFLALLNSFLIIKSTQTSNNQPTPDIPTPLKPTQLTINNHIFNLETAITPLEKSLGLMHRSHLNNKTGMLFIFDDNKPRSFWMKNTLIPLDLIFINDNYQIIDIKHNFQPCIIEPCKSYTSKEPAMYVLEINGGLAKELNIKTENFIKIFN